MKHYELLGFIVQNQQLEAIYNGGRRLAKTCRRQSLVCVVLAAMCPLLPKIEAKAQTTESSVPPVNGVKVVTYAVFKDQLLKALAKQRLNVAAYSRDIELISGLAEKCPAQMPPAPFNGAQAFYQAMGGVAKPDPYYNTAAARACEFTPVLEGPRGYLLKPNPLINGTEPRKLYLLSRAVFRSVVMPGSNKTAFELRVYVEPVDQSVPSEQRCGGNIQACMQEILTAVVIPESELVVAQHRTEDAKRKQASAVEQQRLETEAQALDDTLDRAVADRGQTDAPSGSQQSTQSAAAPSDDDIIQAAKERLRREALQSIAAEYGQLSRLSGDAFGTLGGMGPASAQRILACTLNAPAEKRSCIENLKGELLAERAARVKEVKDPNFGAGFVYTVQEKNNYEGNYVAFVNMRQRGSDTAWRLKLLLQFRNGAWVVIEKSEKKLS